MPVTARLSKLFYDRLGEAVTNELVDWFNQVDAAYKSDLRDMNDLNFARFDAKLEQRLAEFRSEMHAGFVALEAKIGSGESRLDAKIGSVESTLDAKIDAVASRLDAKIDMVAAQITAGWEAALRDQTRFFFLAWAVLLASNIALWFR